MSKPYTRGQPPRDFVRDGPLFLKKEFDKITQSIAATIADVAALSTGLTPFDWTYTPVLPLGRSGWTLSASATYASGPTSNAVDGDTTTRWSTGAAVVPGTTYFRVDMGSAQSVGAVVMDSSSFAGDVPTTGNIQSSDDGTTWTTVASWTSADITNGILAKAWVAASHRYWQLLAESTPAVSTNWWSIGEINFGASMPTNLRYQTASKTWAPAVSRSVILTGQFTKAATTDFLALGLGLDQDDGYALEVPASTSYVNLIKTVAGVRTQLGTIGFDSDTSPHAFEFIVGVPATGGAANWLTLRVGRTGNPPVTLSATDSGLNLTTGTGNFLLKASGPTVARACAYALV